MANDEESKEIKATEAPLADKLNEQMLINNRRNTELDKREESLNKLEADFINEKTTSILKANEELDKIKSQISKASAEKASIQREVEIEKNNKQSEIDRYCKEAKSTIDTKTANSLNKLNEKIADDYGKTISTLDASITKSRENLLSKYEELSRLYDTFLDDKKSLYEKGLTDLQQAKSIYDKAVEEIKDDQEQRAYIDAKTKELEKEKKLLDSTINKLVKDKSAELQIEYDKLVESNKNLISALKIKSKQLATAEEKLTSVEVIKSIDVDRELSTYRQKYNDLLSQTHLYSKEELEALTEKVNDYDNLVQQCSEQNETIRQLEKEKNQIKNAKEDYDSLKYQNNVYQAQIKAERLILENLEQTIEELNNRINRAQEIATSKKSIEECYKYFLNKTVDNNKNKNEIEWLKNISEKCLKSGYKFSERLLYSFHTSLLVSDMSPLTVLAGVSGTGKSKLPQLYSYFGGLYFISIPVQPDYDSPQSLFGYYNSIEKKFEPTSLLQAIVPFQKDKSKSDTKENIEDLSDGVLIALLDEMNLAHVELYFSDLLSKLEERRDGNENVSIELSLGDYNYEVALTNNVKWIGTMNEDETTKSLSDKVIDRGNIISFSKPKQFERYMDRNNIPLESEAPKISKELWKSWVDSRSSLTKDEFEFYVKPVQMINDVLSYANRAIGHRVWQSIEDYMISHPLVKKYKNDKNNRSTALKYAFEEALVYKVMPKLRGIETDGTQRTDCLDKIPEILKDYVSNEFIDDFNKSIDEVTGTFNWNSSSFLDVEYKFGDK